MQKKLTLCLAQNERNLFVPSETSLHFMELHFYGLVVQWKKTSGTLKFHLYLMSTLDSKINKTIGL